MRTEAPTQASGMRSALPLMDMVVIGIISLILGAGLAFVSEQIPKPAAKASTATESSGLPDLSAFRAPADAIAATAGNLTVYENEVEDEISTLRKSYALEDPMAWGQWLKGGGYTVESIRTAAIEGLVSNKLVEAECESAGMSATDEEIDALYKQYAEQLGGEDKLKAMLDEQGESVENYKALLGSEVKQKKLSEAKFGGDIGEADPEVLFEIVMMYYPDSIDEDAENLDGVKPEVVEQAKKVYREEMLYEKFMEWIDGEMQSTKIDARPMPMMVPYYVDLAQVPESDAGADGLLGAEGLELGDVEAGDGDSEEDVEELTGADDDSEDEEEPEE